MCFFLGSQYGLHVKDKYDFGSLCAFDIIRSMHQSVPDPYQCVKSLCVTLLKPHLIGLNQQPLPMEWALTQSQQTISYAIIVNALPAYSAYLAY